MAIKNTALTVCYVAWDTANNAGKTGDVSNHTLRLVIDGTEATPANSASEVDATNLPGIYKITLTADEMNADFVVLGGKSSTADISIMPTIINTEGGLLSGLNTRLTSDRAGYLDNLNVAGTLANTNNADSFKADVSSLGTSANQTTIINAVNALSPGDATLANQNIIIAAVTGIGSQSGAGAETVTLTLTDEDGNPIADADVWITNDADGDNVVAGTKQTNSEGEVVFYLDEGSTYYRWAQKDGYNFTNPSSFVAVGD